VSSARRPGRKVRRSSPSLSTVARSRCRSGREHDGELTHVLDRLAARVARCDELRPASSTCRRQDGSTTNRSPATWCRGRHLEATGDFYVKSTARSLDAARASGSSRCPTDGAGRAPDRCAQPADQASCARRAGGIEPRRGRPPAASTGDTRMPVAFGDLPGVAMALCMPRRRTTACAPGGVVHEQRSVELAALGRGVGGGPQLGTGRPASCP
jgi:hypothetical protein